MTTARTIKQTVYATEQSEGAGARVRRSIGSSSLRNLSPFLLLDHFSSGAGSGFPDHPHRGQETITYMLSGGFQHEDFAGNAGTIWAGDLQFMKAGRGIMHSEMPVVQTDGTLNAGLQLWVDLKEEEKLGEPTYRDLKAAEIPSVKSEDGKALVKIIAGRSQGTESVRDLAGQPVWLVDVTLQPGGRVAQEVPAGWTAFAYVLSGSVSFGEGPAAKKVKQFENAVFDTDGDHVVAALPADAIEEARFVFVAGEPLDQKVVQYGPFVLTTEQGVRQALRDYQMHTNGFERAEGWRSEIGKRMVH